MGKLFATLCLAAVVPLAADENTTKIEIHVTNLGGHPVDQASVTVKFVEGRDKFKFGAKIRQEWDVRTNQEGIVKIPAIPKGSILIQVHAPNYQTFGQTLNIREDEKVVEIKLNPPQKQFSVHEKDK
ncbi:MAG TPA: carboxypeptidase-like regulatory domain-containing protein [Bryobacteraceae bacterium]|nr:carboxypeptidase-like regulatory domain-containing protein [Bryobacteraceae bacterium]